MAEMVCDRAQRTTGMTFTMVRGRLKGGNTPEALSNQFIFPISGSLRLNDRATVKYSNQEYSAGVIHGGRKGTCLKSN